MKIEQVEKNIQNYVDEFVSSLEYKAWKENDNKLYTSKDLIPYFNKKKEYEENLKGLIYGIKEYELLLKEYFEYVNSLTQLESIKQYLYSYQDIQNIKKIIEKELLEKLK